MRELEKLTLNQVKKSPKISQKTFRASDFLTSQEQQELRESNLKGRKSRRKFDEIDQFAAEIMHRFGYDAYLAWNNGEIEQKRMEKYILAERSRESASLADLLGVIMSMVGSCIKREKGQPAPKGPKIANKILRDVLKTAKGEK